jgi:hypothetical protein
MERGMVLKVVARYEASVGISDVNLVGVGELRGNLVNSSCQIRSVPSRTHPKHGARVVLVILEGHTAIPRIVGVDVGLQPIISEGMLASQTR